MTRSTTSSAGLAVGIDLGTVSATVAVLRGEHFETVPNAEGSFTTPSIVSFADDGRVLVGEAARRRAVSHPRRTVCSVKRHMGTDWTFTVDATTYTPEALSGFVLAKLKRDAEAHLGEPVTAAVLTVPAYFSEIDRRATREAAHAAGLETLRIINEPTAAAFACDYSRLWDHDWEDSTVLVVHFGGGTFDVSLIEVGDGVTEVKATCGDNQLGGDDWDAALTEHLAARYDIDTAADPAALRRLREAAERAKVDLSSRTETEIALPYLSTSPKGSLHLHEHLTRSTFHALTSDILTRCEGPLRRVFDDAAIPTSEVSHVMLIGGSTRMPAIRELACRVVDPQAKVLHLPGETVAHGAALQAAVMRGVRGDLLLLDVTPLSLGLGINNGGVRHIIERNTTIPTRRTEYLQTHGPAADTLRIPVCQGEGDTLADNVILGYVKLTGLGPAASSNPLEVTFDLDTSGLLSLQVKHPVTGKEEVVPLAPAPPPPRQMAWQADVAPTALSRIAAKGKACEGKGPSPAPETP